MEFTDTIATLLMEIECHEADMNQSELEFFEFCMDAFDVDQSLPEGTVEELEELLSTLDERAGFWEADEGSDSQDDYGAGF